MVALEGRRGVRVERVLPSRGSLKSRFGFLFKRCVVCVSLCVFFFYLLSVVYYDYLEIYVLLFVKCIYCKYQIVRPT